MARSMSSSSIDSFICFCHKNHCFDLVTITFSNHVYDLLHFQMYVQFSTAAVYTAARFSDLIQDGRVHACCMSSRIACPAVLHVQLYSLASQVRW